MAIHLSNLIKFFDLLGRPQLLFYLLLGLIDLRDPVENEFLDAEIFVDEHGVPPL